MTMVKFQPDRSEDIFGFWSPAKDAMITGHIGKRIERRDRGNPFFLLRLTSAQTLILRKRDGTTAPTRCERGDIIGISEYRDLRGLATKHASCTATIACTAETQSPGGSARWFNFSVDVSDTPIDWYDVEPHPEDPPF